MITSMTITDHIYGDAPFVYEGDLARGTAQAAELGYDGVELHIADPDQVDAPSLEAALRSSGLLLTAIGTGRAYVNDGLSITDPDQGRRQAAIARLERFLALAGRFRAKIIIGCMRGNLSSPQELPAALDRLRAAMEHLDRAAGSQGVSIVFEPINRYENNFLCTMRDISSFIRESGLENTGLLVDTFHMNIEEADLFASIRDCAAEIRYVHAADSNRRYPGQGHLPFAELLRALRDAGYDGVVSAECLPWPGKREAAEGWIRSMRRLLREAGC